MEAIDSRAVVAAAEVALEPAAGVRDWTNCCKTMGWCSGWKAVLAEDAGAMLIDVKAERVEMGAERRALRMEDMILLGREGVFLAVDMESEERC